MTKTIIYVPCKYGDYGGLELLDVGFLTFEEAMRYLITEWPEENLSFGLTVREIEIRTISTDFESIESPDLAD